MAVAEELHFGRAAQRLHIAQPALSQAIAKLERELEVVLLQRTSRKVELTPAGAAFLERARRTLALTEEAAEAARRAARGETGSLELAFTPVARFEVVPEVASAFTERYPTVSLRAQEMFSGPLLEALLGHRVSVGFVMYPNELDGLAGEPLRRERSVALVSLAKPLAARREIDLIDLAGERFLLWERDESPGLYDRIVEMCRAAGFEPEVEEVSLAANEDGRFFRQGRGVTLAPASTRRFAFEGTAFVPIRDLEATFELSMLWREDASPAASAFVDVARGVAADRAWLAID